MNQGVNINDSMKARAKELYDDQSVRTTFRLNEDAAIALKDLSKKLKLPIKAVIDRALNLITADIEIEGTAIGAVLLQGSLIDMAKKSDADLPKTVRKTMVIRKGALRKLKSLSEEHQAPRDLILSVGINLLSQLIEFSEKEVREKDLRALPKIKKILKRLKTLEAELLEIYAGNEDEPLYTRFRIIVTMLDMLKEELDERVKYGTEIYPPY